MLYQTILSPHSINLPVSKNAQTWGYNAPKYLKYPKYQTWGYNAHNSTSYPLLTSITISFLMQLFKNLEPDRQPDRGDLFKSFKNTTMYGLQTVQYFGSKLWNTLPLFITSYVAIFWSKLKTLFWQISCKVIPNILIEFRCETSGNMFDLFLIKICY